MKLHTFVICAYKESPYLEECIKSLLIQESRSEERRVGKGVERGGRRSIKKKKSKIIGAMVL